MRLCKLYIDLHTSYRVEMLKANHFLPFFLSVEPSSTPRLFAFAAGGGGMSLDIRAMTPLPINRPSSEHHDHDGSKK